MNANLDNIADEVLTIRLKITRLKTTGRCNVMMSSVSAVAACWHLPLNINKFSKWLISKMYDQNVSWRWSFDRLKTFIYKISALEMPSVEVTWATSAIFFPLWPEVWPITFELHLVSRSDSMSNIWAKCHLFQKLLSQHTWPTALPGPLKWSIKSLHSSSSAWLITAQSSVNTATACYHFHLSTHKTSILCGVYYSLLLSLHRGYDQKWPSAISNTSWLACD